MSVYGELRQTVRVAGEVVWAHDCAIQEGLRELTRVSVVVEDPEWVPRLGDTLQVDQEVDLPGGGVHTYSVTAEITDVTEARGNVHTFYRVEARGEGYTTRHRRLLRTWRNTPAEQLIEEAFAEAAPDIDLSGVDAGAGTVGEYDSRYDSLYDLMDTLAERFGWAWRIRDGVLYWRDPNTFPGPDLDASDIERGTLEVQRSLDSVFNVARVVGYEYQHESMTKRVEPGECLRAVSIPGKRILSDEWEVVGQAQVTEGLEDWIGSVGRVGDGSKMELDPPLGNPDCDGAEAVRARVEWDVRRPVWVRAQRKDSIAVYGRREAPPLSDDGSRSISSARDKLEAYLNEHAWPPVSIQAGLVRPDVRADQVVAVTLQDPPVDRTLIVESVRRTVSGNDLQVEVELASPEENGGSTAGAASTDDAGATRAAQTDPNPLREAVRRVEHLERDAMASGTLRGSSARSLGDLEGTESYYGRWGWDGALEVEGAPMAVIAGRWGWAGRWEPAVDWPVSVVFGRWSAGSIQHTDTARAAHRVWTASWTLGTGAIQPRVRWEGAWVLPDDEITDEPRGLVVGSEMVMPVTLTPDPGTLVVGQEFTMGSTQ